MRSTRTQILHLTQEAAEQCSKVHCDSNIDMDLLSAVELIFKSQVCINGSFLLSDDQHFCCTSKYPGVDLNAAAKAFNFLRNVENDGLKSLVRSWYNVLLDGIMCRCLVHHTYYIYMYMLFLDMGKDNKWIATVINPVACRRWNFANLLGFTPVSWICQLKKLRKTSYTL